MCLGISDKPYLFERHPRSIRQCGHPQRHKERSNRPREYDMDFHIDRFYAYSNPVGGDPLPKIEFSNRDVRLILFPFAAFLDFSLHEP